MENIWFKFENIITIVILRKFNMGICGNVRVL